MAPPSCWRCLLRPSTATAPSPSAATRRLLLPLATATATATTTAPPSPPQLAARSFSTTARRAATAAKPGVHQRTGKRMRLVKYKKKDISHPKTPGPGQRKAWRKRIVLSNNNAVPVRGMDVMQADNLALPASAGRVFKIPEVTTDQLRAVDAFKSSQTWWLFHSPHALVRRETVRVCAAMLASAARGETARIVITGDKAAGKSIVLLQAIANAFLNNWLVINIPEGQDLTTASTEYAPIPDTNPQQWMQHIYALALMRKIRVANKALLDKIYTTRSYEDFTNPVAEGATLNTLIESAHESDQAWPVFSALWYELFAVKTDNIGNPRPPIMFALDGLAAIMRVSDYRSIEFERIHAHDLAIVRMFVDVLSGRTPLPNGGAVVAATCRSNAARNASMELALARHIARQSQGAQPLPERDPYCRKYDPRVDAVLEDNGIDVVDVRGVGKAEARALMEYWAASGILRARVDESTVSEKWMTGGNGIIGEMEKAGLLTLRL